MELDHCSYKIWPYAGNPGESDATRHDVGGSDNAIGAGNQQERLDPSQSRESSETIRQTRLARVVMI